MSFLASKPVACGFRQGAHGGWQGRLHDGRNDVEFCSSKSTKNRLLVFCFHSRVSFFDNRVVWVSLEMVTTRGASLTIDQAFPLTVTTSVESETLDCWG